MFFDTKNGSSLIVSSRVPGGAAQDLRLKPIKLRSKSSKTIKHGSIPDPIQLETPRRRSGLTKYRMFRSSTSRSDPIRAAIYVFLRDKEEKSRTNKHVWITVLNEIVSIICIYQCMLFTNLALMAVMIKFFI